MNRRWLGAFTAKQWFSGFCIVGAMLCLVGFAATFGTRWALVAAVPCLVILGVAAGE